MPRYELEFRETRTLFFTVEAASEEEAVELAEQREVEPDSDQFESMERQ